MPVLTADQKAYGVSAMEQGTSIFELAGFALITLVVVILRVRGGSQWETGINADFQAALKNLHIVSYELLVDRTIAPGSNTYAEVYRILRDQDDRYFLYILLDDAKGVMKPLTKERALLAVKMSPYQKQT
ncbi:hypothetical protein QPL90_04665 [Pseudomonas syringae pv. syringae]|uniref:hypothetical protein n=1 Tax=Pseudomonas syringae group TaxID=136849 RepID=UPI000E3260E6|nr:MULTISPECIES: hypothetical protein [Pseudomonas syringae group]MEE1990803.1 hypothetical protein [Pseudomonas syringae pv. syringae]MEE1996157.1 hypothetical protein [Pseudomonas syringae pv. syringae]